jgi:4,5-dihydroxyphthalate decarboxylase
MVRKRVVEQNPWVPEALFEAFEASKQAAYRRDPRTVLVFPNADPGTQAELYGPDPFPSGLQQNRPMLELCARQSQDEGLTTRPVDIDGLFYESVRGA